MVTHSQEKQKTDTLAQVKSLFKPSDFAQTKLDTQSLDEGLIHVAQSYLADTQQPVPPDLGVPQTLNLLTDLLENPDQDFLTSLESLIAQAVRVHQPAFIGHMTSALPSYVPSLMYLLGALNQNQVKLETSGGLSVIEKHVLKELHQLFFSETSSFYTGYLNNPDMSLGAFCSGGTLGNLSAFWAYRKAFDAVYPDLKPKARIYVSELGHYSIRKAVDVIGLDAEQVVILPNVFFKQDTAKLKQKMLEDQILGYRALAVVGVAGTTETGSVDHLDALADISTFFKCFFHVDAAWGGAFYCVDSLKTLFKGIERADAIVIDAHKQLFVPIGCGIVLFKDENLVQKLEYHANYIIRKGSYDLGQFTLEGSRPAMSLILWSHLRLIGFAGFNVLFQSLHELAVSFADHIKATDDFELISEPALNILTYRYCPAEIAQAAKSNAEVHGIINEVTQRLHKLHRATGMGFVSRTRLPYEGQQEMIDVFRVVLANPNTTIEHCKQVLAEQRIIVEQDEVIQSLLKQAFI